MQVAAQRVHIRSQQMIRHAFLRLVSVHNHQNGLALGTKGQEKKNVCKKENMRKTMQWWLELYNCHALKRKKKGKEQDYQKLSNNITTFPTLASNPMRPARPHICRNPATFKNLSPMRGDLKQSKIKMKKMTIEF